MVLLSITRGGISWYCKVFVRFNCETQPPASIGWVALSSVVVRRRRHASVTSPLISTIWCFRAYKPYIFCEDMILATCQCQHIFCCWVEPSFNCCLVLVMIHNVTTKNQPSLHYFLTVYLYSSDFLIEKMCHLRLTHTIFIGPRYTWGPIYWSESSNLGHAIVPMRSWGPSELKTQFVHLSLYFTFYSFYENCQRNSEKFYS